MEYGRNLSLPPVRYTKSKIKRHDKEVKKQTNRKIHETEQDYTPPNRISLHKYKILPKDLRTRRVPGFSPKLQDIQEISQNLSQETNVHWSQNFSEPLKEPYQVNEETISKLQQDINKIKLKFKRVPGSTDWVPYEDIKKFHQTTEED